MSVSVCLSVTEVHWRIIAIGFKFRSQLTAHCGRGACGREHSTTELNYQWARGKGSSPGRVEGSSRAMLATARPSCFYAVMSIIRHQRSDLSNYFVTRTALLWCLFHCFIENSSLFFWSLAWSCLLVFSCGYSLKIVLGF